MNKHISKMIAIKILNKPLLLHTTRHRVAIQTKNSILEKSQQIYVTYEKQKCSYLPFTVDDKIKTWGKTQFIAHSTPNSNSTNPRPLTFFFLPFIHCFSPLLHAPSYEWVLVVKPSLYEWGDRAWVVFYAVGLWQNCRTRYGC